MSRLLDRVLTGDRPVRASSPVYLRYDGECCARQQGPEQLPHGVHEAGRRLQRHDVPLGQQRVAALHPGAAVEDACARRSVILTICATMAGLRAAMSSTHVLWTIRHPLPACLARPDLPGLRSAIRPHDVPCLLAAEIEKHTRTIFCTTLVGGEPVCHPHPAPCRRHREACRWSPTCT